MLIMVIIQEEKSMDKKELQLAKNFKLKLWVILYKLQT